MKLRRVTKQLLSLARDATSADRALSALYVYFTKKRAVLTDTILLEANKGDGFVGNPYYMALHMASDAAYRKFTMVIVAPRGSWARLRKIMGGARVAFCRPKTPRYCYFLATSQILVNDTTFPPYFSRRPGQTYLNTWHGTPLKAMGRDVASQGILQLSNPQRNFLHATHILCPNEHTERVLLKSYMIEDIWCGSILRGGYPRNDVLVSDAPRPEPSDCCHIAFMPTWRGTVFLRAEESEKLVADLGDLLRALEEGLPQNVHVWLRLHPFVTKSISLEGMRRVHAFPIDVEPYSFLAKCDALLTDYSSVLFDFAASGKPVLLYVPDEAEYRNSRNFSINLGELPFPKLGSVDELIEAMSNVSRRNAEVKVLDTFRAKYCPHDNGSATTLLCRHVVLGIPTVTEVKLRPDGAKKNVLLFTGGFLNNGITSSLKSLIPLLDLTRINLTLCIDARVATERASDYLSSMDRRVGFIATRRNFPLDPADCFRYLGKLLFAGDWNKDDKVLLGLFHREARRTFGSAEFDAVVHFTGYDRHVATMICGMHAAKVVYMHNDMWKEIRKKGLADPRPLRMAVDAADTVAVVRKGVEHDYCLYAADVSRKVAFVPNALPTHCVRLSLLPIEVAFAQDMPSQEKDRAIQGLAQPGKFRFVNVGRFSAEKGQDRLIRAFEQVWLRQQESQLYIVGSYGPLFDEICAMAKRSIAAAAIFVVKGSTNPFPLLARMNSFVLSSHYEGLPIVLFESLALGVPIVATDIPGVTEFLSEGYGVTVENSQAGLTTGMLDSICGKQTVAEYDIDAHNRHAAQKFHSMIDSSHR